ncbi:MaoC family dehydratase [Rhodoligotrophos ferricapiens]|uniref:MaoC family dehydratase n=1 Tax=Rhodoligotrophos ferricapiens TaxID=3069264 RepID=UPI00315D7441
MSVLEGADGGWVPPFSVGETFTRDVLFDVETVKAFARLAMDDNPLHHDEAFARTTRFGGLIASGTHTMAVTTGPVASFLSERCASLGLQFDYTLRRAIRAGERATIAWTIDDLSPKASLGGYLVRMTGRLINSTGEDAVIVKGTSLLMPKSGLQA